MVLILDDEYLSNQTSRYRSVYLNFDYLVLFDYDVCCNYEVGYISNASIVNSKRRVICDCD